MNTIIKESFKQLIADKYLFVVLLLLVILSLVAATVIGLSIHPSELQLVSHYSAFGVTNLYRDQWFYLFVFVVYELVVAALHTVISVKLLVTKGHSIAILFAWLGVGLVAMGWITALAVLNVWKPI